MKRRIASFIVILLLVSSFNISSAFAKSDGPGEPEIVPYGYVVELDKPIVDTGVVYNSQLGEMIDEYENGSWWLGVINTVLFAGGVTAPAGVVNSLVAAISTKGDTAIERAYENGENMYYATVYASGVEPSLTKQAYVYYSKTPITFVNY